MKNKIKKLSIAAAALCAVAGAAGILGACGEKEVVYDYESLSWEDWNSISESTWDKKTITYQIVTGDMENPDGADHSNRNILLFNFYEDGTLVIWQAGLYTTSEGMTDAAWVDEDRNIAWIYYGFWEQTDTDLTVYYFASKAEVECVEQSASWAESNDFCYSYVFTKEGDNYVLDNAELTEPMVTLGFNQMAEEWSFTEKLTTSTTIQYETVQSWVDKYLEDKANGDWTQI